jgi:pimeloyl-ACP methyl ester carboxylesterase
MASHSFVLLHGAFHGAWCWREVARLLRQHGHQVTTPTQTGLGERHHLLSPSITVETFIEDLIEHIRYSEVSDAVLVGHSFGGIALAGAADRIPARIRQLIFLDSRIVQNGQSAFDTTPPELVAQRRAQAAEHGNLFLPPPPAESFGVPAGKKADRVNRLLTPHPFATFENRVRLAHPLGNGLPCTYIACTRPATASLAPSRTWAREQPRWGYRELETGHDAMITAPLETAKLLMELAE